MPIISDPQRFNVDDLYVDLRTSLALPVYLKCEGFNFAGSVKLKAAVEKLFKVKVEEVRTANFEGKLRRRGRFAGYKPDWKKAYVRLKAGEKVPDFASI